MTSKKEMEKLFSKAQFADDVLAAARKHGLFGRKRDEARRKSAGRSKTARPRSKAPASPPVQKTPLAPTTPA